MDKALKVLATADGGTAAPFSISLQGFGPALDRIAALVSDAMRRSHTAVATLSIKR